MSVCSISIIIPAYNVDKYLTEALDSIKNQVEMPDEVILIDDGSTDKTLSIANSYDFPFPYRVVSIENGGQGNARNIGVNLASSDYIYYFDSDDLLDKNFVREIKAKIKKYNMPDIILFSGTSFDDEEYKGSRWMSYLRGFSGYFQYRVDFLDEALKNRGLFCSPCLYISKKRLWNKKEIKFGNNFLEDEAIFFPLIFSCENFLVMNEVFFYRRNREGSTMTTIPTIKHVNGALDSINTTLTLYYSKSYSKRENWHIRKRLGNQTVSYIYMAKKAGQSVLYGKLFNIFLITRDLGNLIRCFAHLFGIHEIRVIRNIRQSIKNSYTKNRK